MGRAGRATISHYREEKGPNGAPLSPPGSQPREYRPLGLMTLWLSSILARRGTLFPHWRVGVGVRVVHDVATISSRHTETGMCVYYEIMNIVYL